MDTLLPKFIISIFCTLVFLFLINNKPFITKLTTNHEYKWLSFALLASRLIPIFIVYLFYHYDAKSDVQMFYEWAVLAKKGAFVYRDFDSPYAPLFSYITAIPLYFYNSANTIVLLMVLIEVGILIMTFYFYSEIYGKNISLYVSLLYLSLPATLILSVVSGQEDVWMWGIIILAMLVYNYRPDSLLVGLIFGIGMITTKVLFVFALPIALILLPNKIRYLIGLAVIGLPTLAILVYYGGDSFLLPIQQANDPRNPNFWSIINPFFNVYKILGIKLLNIIGLVSNIILVVALSIKAKELKKTFNEALPLIWLISSLWVMVIQQSSLSNYCFVYLMPLIFIYASSKKNNLIILLLSFACTIQPPLWWGLKMPTFNHISDLRLPLNALEYILEILIIGCIVYFCSKLYTNFFVEK
jgi:hypothetical protein